ncbi:MAG: methylated-DNA--[protein]-cysteine S-methyltransferase [Sulfuricella sp.]
MKVYQARLVTPFAVLGIVTDHEQLTGIDFLPVETKALEPQNLFAREVCAQLQAYLADPQFIFELPLLPRGTPYQQKVWQALLKIPAGQSESYGALARQLGSAPRAIGQACGANPIPVVIPCHRVLGKDGLGGFMNHSDGGALQIKRWLLEHEHVQLRPAG